MQIFVSDKVPAAVNPNVGRNVYWYNPDNSVFNLPVFSEKAWTMSALNTYFNSQFASILVKIRKIMGYDEIS